MFIVDNPERPENKELPVLVNKRTKFYLGLIYILIVAIFMNTFELIFFVFMICPKETEILKGFLNNLNLFPILPTMPEFPTAGPIGPVGPVGPAGPEVKSPETYFNDYFDVMIHRENQIIDMYNMHLVVFIVIEIGILLIILLIFYSKVKFRDSISTLMLCLKTVLTLCFFQVNLFYFALKFLYTTQEEIQYLVLKKLKEELSE